MRPLYLDHLATTPCDARVVQALLPYLTESFGNAGSRGHAYGWAADEAVKQARERVAALIGATPREIIFTSGATEANNLALKGAAEAGLPAGRHVITQVTEHRAVLAPVAVLEAVGFEVTRLPVDAWGRVDPAAVAAALRPSTVLVSIMHANNEIGTVQPIAEIGALCRARGVLFHTDAAQSAGKIPLDVKQLNVDLLSLSAHKIYGPKGVGALYVRHGQPRVQITAQLHGGGQERGLRAGTVPVHQVVGFGAAAELARVEGAAEAERLRGLRDGLQAAITAALAGVRVNGHPTERLPGALHLSFEGVDGSSLLPALRGLALSTGSACMSDPPEPSHVLQAIGLAPAQVHTSLRFGLGRSTTAAEVTEAARQVVEAVQHLRAARSLRPGASPVPQSLRQAGAPGPGEDLSCSR